MSSDVKYFALPVAATVSMFGWWFYALTHAVNFPGNLRHKHYHQPNGNVIGFNLLLITVVALVWAGGFLLSRRASAGSGSTP